MTHSTVGKVPRALMLTEWNTVLNQTHWWEHQIDKEKQNQDVSTLGLDIYLMTSLSSELMEARGLLSV